MIHRTVKDTFFLNYRFNKLHRNKHLNSYFSFMLKAIFLSSRSSENKLNPWIWNGYFRNSKDLDSTNE